LRCGSGDCPTRHCERSEAIQLSFVVTRKLDCFVASAPRNDDVPDGLIPASIGVRRKHFRHTGRARKADLLSRFNKTA
jgi:hypothetical protein